MGACAAIIIAGALALLGVKADEASLIIMPFLVNCAAAASLAARCVMR